MLNYITVPLYTPDVFYMDIMDYLDRYMIIIHLFCP